MKTLQDDKYQKIISKLISDDILQFDNESESVITVILTFSNIFFCFYEMKLKFSILHALTFIVHAFRSILHIVRHIE